MSLDTAGPVYENGESGKSVEELSSASSNEPEASPKKKVDSDRNKESKARSHHKEDRDRSSTHGSHHHHKSSREDRPRPDRHKEDRLREERDRESDRKRHDASRERDGSRRHRDRKQGKERSRSVSSRRRKERQSSRERQSGRRHESRERKGGRRDRESGRRESSARRDARKHEEAAKSNKADADKSSKTLETQPKSQLKTSKESTPASLLNPGGTPNAQEILKSIKIPDHLKYNQVEAQKYQMEQLRLKTEELTGIKVPSFYNTSAINPLVYAEQQKKRKLLWSKAKDNGTTTTSLIGKAIVEGQDEKTSEKFRKLMGLKSTELEGPSSLDATTRVKEKFHTIAQAMDKEYEMARMTTHTHRGQGLGFATAAFFDPNQPRP